MTGVATRLELADPGFIRVRRGARTVVATVLSGMTLAVLTSMLGVANPTGIALFGAGACFFAALLVVDVTRTERVRTFTCAAVVSAVAIVATVELTRVAVWAAVAFLVGQMFLSYALRSWSVRAGTVAVVGALITFLVGASHLTSDRMWWFVIASTVGCVWVVVAEYVILPDDPDRTLKQSVEVMCRGAGEAIAGVGNSHTALDRLRTCRRRIDGDEQLRVALYCMERGAVVIVSHTDDTIPTDIAESLKGLRGSLEEALSRDAEPQSLDIVVAEAQHLRNRIHDAPHLRPESAQAALTTIGGVELVAQSASRAVTLAPSTAQPTTAPPAPTFTPNMALAVQAAVAAVAAGLIAKWFGNEQSLLVVWSAYVVIVGSAEASRRRAWLWLTATVVGSTAGVAVAASVPDRIAWTAVAVTIGVFCTIVTAPVSYPAMVFWMNIALVPIFATEGRYLDLIWDKSIAALIGGSVGAVVALTVLPIRLTRDFRPAVLRYLEALDAALESQLPSETDRRASTGAALDRAHAALDAMVASAPTKTHLFPQLGSQLTEQGVRIDAIHEAYLRLTPLLTDSSRRVHGWADPQIAIIVRKLRDAVDATKKQSESLELMENLRASLDEFAGLLRGAPPSD